jgi:diacylglycerol O-acyltransferase
MPKLRGGERLSAADASHVVMDARDQVNVFLMAGILGAGGFVSADGGVDLDPLRVAIADRLADPAFKDLARFSQRVQLDGSLQWQACEPDLVWHVRLVGPVDGREGLAGLCATLMTVMLPLDRPMWELLIVPGASQRGPGVILRVHHAVADGVTGVRLVQRLFDSSPAPEGPPSRLVPATPQARWRWRTFVTSVSRVLAVFRATVPPTVLLGPIGAVRGVAFADVELGTLARAAKAVGATVNDALLAATSVAAEAALRADGQPVPRVLPASIPVALADRGASGNAVGVMLVPLRTGESDAGVRLARIAAATRAAKSEARAQGTYELTRTRWGSRLFAWLARRQRFIALFVTNVHGPDRPILIGQAPLEHAWPVAPIQGNVRFGVAAMSYAGRFGVAVHVDAGALRAGVAGRALGDELARIAARQ